MPIALQAKYFKWVQFSAVQQEWKLTKKELQTFKFKMNKTDQ